MAAFVVDPVRDLDLSVDFSLSTTGQMAGNVDTDMIYNFSNGPIVFKCEMVVPLIDTKCLEKSVVVVPRTPIPCPPPLANATLMSSMLFICFYFVFHMLSCWLMRARRSLLNKFIRLSVVDLLSFLGLSSLFPSSITTNKASY